MKFVSVHDGIIGSIYFADAAGHRRIRLVHPDGPSIGAMKLNGEWYFPPPETPFPGRNATTGEIDAWLQQPKPIPNSPVEGHKIIEYNAGHNMGAGRHRSRGVVKFLLINQITQRDINIIYDTIMAFPPAPVAANPPAPNHAAAVADYNEQNNQALRTAILNHNLSFLLRQSPLRQQ